MWFRQLKIGESMGHPGDRERNMTKTEEQVVIHKLNYRRYDGLEFYSCNYTNDAEYSSTEITQVVT